MKRKGDVEGQLGLPIQFANFLRQLGGPRWKTHELHYFLSFFECLLPYSPNHGKHHFSTNFLSKILYSLYFHHNQTEPKVEKIMNQKLELYDKL